MSRGSLRSSFTLVAALLLLGASSASALEFSVLGPTTVTVEPGEPFTIDIALDNVMQETVQGLKGTISGLADAGAVPLAGRAAVDYFAIVCLPTPTGCLGGIRWINDLFSDPNDLAFTYQPGDDSLLIVDTLGLQATTADGSIDPGLDGDVTEPSARDVMIDLMAQTVGLHVLTIGGIFSDGTRTLPIANEATLILRVIPEPGLALLLGLGLAALSARR